MPIVLVRVVRIQRVSALAQTPQHKTERRVVVSAQQDQQQLRYYHRAQVLPQSQWLVLPLQVVPLSIPQVQRMSAMERVYSSLADSA